MDKPMRDARDRSLVDAAIALYKRGGIEREAAEDSIALHTISRKLHHLDEAACNYGLTPGQEKRLEALDAQAAAIGQKYSLVTRHQGDPRGWSLYLAEKAEDCDPWRGLSVCPY